MSETTLIIPYFWLNHMDLLCYLTNKKAALREETALLIETNG